MTEDAAKDYAAECLESGAHIVYRAIQKRLGKDWSFYGLGLNKDNETYRMLNEVEVPWNEIRCNCHHEEPLMYQLFTAFMETWEWQGVWRFNICCYWPHYHTSGDVTINGTNHIIDVIFEPWQEKPFWSFAEDDEQPVPIQRRGD